MACLLHVVISGDMAGGQRVCLDIVLDRLSMGDQVHVATPSHGAFTEQCPAEVSVEQLPFRSLKDILHLPKLVRYLRQVRPDLVHTHTGVPCNILWRLACKIAGVPIITHIHIENYFGRRLILARLVKFLDTVTSHFTAHHIVVSKDTARSLLSQGYTDKNLSVIYNGVPVHEPITPPSGRSSAANSNTIIGCVARLCPGKGQVDLLKALPKILESRPNAVLWLIGKDQQNGGGYENFLKDLEFHLQNSKT